MNEVKICSDFIETPKKRNSSLNFLGSPSSPLAIYPELLGKTRGIQQIENDHSGKMVWPIFCYPLAELNSKEVFTNIIKLAKNPNYSANGVVHVIINNEAEDFCNPQIESSCKLVKIFAEYLNAPVIHVKADDVDSVIYVMNLAAEYRANHLRDIVIDLITPTSVYSPKNVALAGLIRELLIGDKYPLISSYIRELSDSKVISKGILEEQKDVYLKKLTRLHSARTSQQYPPFMIKKKNLVNLEKRYKEPLTGASPVVVQKITQAMTTSSRDCVSTESYELQVKRHDLLVNNMLDWDICETLAYTTLMQEGKNVRISQNSRDQHPGLNFLNGENGNSLHPAIGTFPILGEFKLCRSDVPPFATAGFETGYSSIMTNTLNIWEAPVTLEPSQLHSIISHYFTLESEEDLASTGVTLIVPNYLQASDNGTKKYYSCQPQRILEACEECEMITSMNDQLQNCNIIVANVSTPANFYHILKRQARCLKQRPLLCFVPNDHRNFSPSFSSLEDILGDTSFQSYIGDPDIASNSSVQHVILCSGKVYYDLKNERALRNFQNKVAISRIEQIFPFPYNNIIQDLERFPQAKVWWVQEEECGEGCWNYIELRLFGILGDEASLKFAGRHKRTNGKYTNLKLSDEELRYIFDMISDSS
ncbi:2-oxoglutarate dehydrogenase-like, mitochondrial isoform X2 [Cimex lectularius]|nr:2-oxoglutarate dehydrogenase-like, mitochondrial isoform X2 [Cimex lectularius]